MTDIPTEEFILKDPCASDWLKHQLQETIRRDPVDACHDAEVLAILLRRRCDQVLEQSLVLIAEKENA